MKTTSWGNAILGFVSRIRMTALGIPPNVQARGKLLAAVPYNAIIYLASLAQTIYSIEFALN
jgi:hypothetical protein